MAKLLTRLSGLGPALLLAGCIGYSVGGQFEGADQEFFGTVSASLADTGTINVTTLDGTLTCTGTSQVTRRGGLSNNIGAQGRAQATCNDGRSFKVDFVQTSSSGGHGQGIDTQGNIISLVFDMSSDAVKARMEQQRLDNLVQ